MRDRLVSGALKATAAVALIGWLCAIALTSGCYCWNAVHAQEPMCVIAHQTVDCTADSAKDAVQSLGPLAAWLLGGANGAPNWDGMLHSLELAGFKNVMCILAQIQNDFFKSKSMSYAQIKTHENYRAYMFKYHPGLKVRLNGVIVE